MKSAAEPQRSDVVRTAARFAVAAAFVAVGLAHFATPDPFVSIVPEALPAPRALVYVSGVAEILGGIGLLVPATRRFAAWGLLLLLVAVFPANINQAVNEIYLEGMQREPWILWARLPLQLVFAALVVWTGLGGTGLRYLPRRSTFFPPSDSNESS